MTSKEKKIYDSIYEKVGKELELPAEVVKGAYEGYWLFAREHIKSLPLKDPNLTEEEFIKLRPSVNFPSLGKFAYPLYKFKTIQLRNKHVKDNDNQEN